jgi:hypothetical protein
VVGYSSGRRDGNINAHAVLDKAGRKAKELRIHLRFMVSPEMASARAVPLQACVVLLWRWTKPALEGLDGPGGEAGIWL